ncbi:hypothetical protein MMC14_007103 [Varicellaria rhodocarpa]|nr:hypothetical protein [Varicellaria rhodocarpa]
MSGSTSVTPSKDDIAVIICFAAKARAGGLKPSLYEERLPPVPLTPSGSPISSNQSTDATRLRRVLDAVAMLCVSRPHEQVIAVALRVTEKEVELVIAENTDIASGTIRHLESMWTDLEALSKKFEKHHGVSKDSPSSQQPSVTQMSPEMYAMVQNFGRKVLKFVIAKIKRRLAKHYSAFVKMEINIPVNHFFRDVYESVVVLESLIGNERILTEEEWTEVTNFFELLEHEVELLPADYFDQPDFKSRMPDSFDVLRYLSKLVSIPKDIKVLLNVANSPRLRNIFRAELKINPLDPVSQSYELPNTALGWKNLITKVLEEKTSLSCPR